MHMRRIGMSRSIDESVCPLVRPAVKRRWTVTRSEAAAELMATGGVTTAALSAAERENDRGRHHQCAHYQHAKDILHFTSPLPGTRRKVNAADVQCWLVPKLCVHDPRASESTQVCCTVAAGSARWGPKPTV
jgi:hypothetical protein